MITVTESIIKKIAPTANKAFLKPMVEAMNEYCPKYEINTPLRMAHFLAQTAHESGGFRRLEESFAYSAERLVEVFPKYFKSLAEAKKVVGKPQAIAERVYGNRPKLGNTKPGDGWKYRGRGIIMNTGRFNYRAAGKEFGLPLEGSPDYAADPTIAVKMACDFWNNRNINIEADNDNNLGATLKVNGGTNGLADRARYLSKAKHALGVAPQALLSPEAPDAPNASGEPISENDPVITPQSGDFLISALQTELKAKHYYDGTIDGVWTEESLTDDAVALLQKRNGLEVGIDAIRLSEVKAAKPYIVATRVDATVDTLKERGDPATTFFGRVKAGAKWALGAVGLGGSAAAVNSDAPKEGVIDKASDTLGLLERGQALVAPVAAPLADTFFFVLHWIWVPVFIGLPAAWLWSWHAEQKRLAAFKTGAA